ncbi:MAG: PilZ domain-containing protein [Myxococcales bacterium]
MTVLLGDRLPAQCSDVGAGGLCVQLAGVFLPGAKVHGSVLLGAQRFPFAGEVAWVSPGNLRQHSLSRVGVRFVSAPQELTGQLAQLERAELRENRQRVTVRRARAA